MSFVAWLALFVGVFAVAPYVAHRLRRRRGEERPFAAVRLVTPAPPQARRRANLEDVPLFVVRLLSVLALAVLGASPLVRCSRLSLTRTSGASVALALVIDDSMSMRAPHGGGAKSRFEVARRSALELLASSREGDSVAIVLAGAPPRVALAATGDLGAARAVLETLSPTDRATDLDVAVNMARGLVAQLPQVDRRIVLLSDRADGRSTAAPLGGGEVPLWVPVPELAAPAVDCAVITADRLRAAVRVHTACSPDASPAGRRLEIVKDGKVVAAAEARPVVDVPVAEDVAPPLVARLSPGDVVAADDEAPVVLEAKTSALAVVVERGEGALPTGGAPAVEQALASLKLELVVRPLPVVPDRIDDLAGFVGIVIDDPPGFTPEQRKALRAFLEAGGVALVALGPRAAASPLGSSFEPLLERPFAWEKAKVSTVDTKSARGGLVEAAATLGDLAARERITLQPADAERADTMLAWSDGAPLLMRVPVGRGEAWVMTLPLSVDASDLPLRPGFLPLLDGIVDLARSRSRDRRTPVGEPWVFVTGGSAVQVTGPGGAPLPVTRDGTLARAVPELAGAYDVRFGADRREQRVASPHAAELDFRPRAVVPQSLETKADGSKAIIDVSWIVALVLLVLFAAEIALRAVMRRREPA